MFYTQQQLKFACLVLGLHVKRSLWTFVHLKRGRNAQLVSKQMSAIRFYPNTPIAFINGLYQLTLSKNIPGVSLFISYSVMKLEKFTICT